MPIHMQNIVKIKTNKNCTHKDLLKSFETSKNSQTYIQETSVLMTLIETIKSFFKCS